MIYLENPVANPRQGRSPHAIYFEGSRSPIQFQAWVTYLHGPEARIIFSHLE